MRILIFVLVCLSYKLKAQDRQIETRPIHGKVVDSVTQKPIDFATVVLKDARNVAIKSVLTQTNGEFTITTPKAIQNSVTVISVGYTSKTVKLNHSANSLDVGIIYIKPATARLKEVTITADKPLMKQELDRISYDLKADPESKVNSVLEMMRKVPMLSLDGEDNIQLQGNTNYKIFINGKPSSMLERSPKDVLRSMPASTIDRIEVITTPPSKYEGEGLAGIINIITNKTPSNGYNGSLNLSERFPVGGPGLGGALNAKLGKFGISALAGGSVNNAPETINTNRVLSAGTNSSNLFQSGLRRSDGNSGYFGTEISFELDSLNLLSGQLNINGNQSEGIINQSSLLNNATGILQSYGLENIREGSGTGIDATLNYQLGFKNNKNRLLTLSYRYLSFETKQINSVDVIEPVFYNQPDYNQENTGHFAEKTIQVDYIQPVNKWMIEAGIKGIFRNNSSNFHFATLGSAGNYEMDPTRSNRFSNTQDVYAIYNTYQLNLKKWGFKGGLRLEQTAIDADFVSAAAEVKQNYLNVLPSVSVSYKLENTSTLNFGFSSRIQRPGINQLNPFVDRSNPNFETTGNPDLEAMTAKLFEINYSRFKKATINVGSRVMFFQDLIMPQITLDPATNINRSSFGNTGSSRLIGFNMNLTYPLTRKLRATVSSNVNHGKVEGKVNGVALQNSGWMSRTFTSLAYRFKKDWQATANVNYNGRNLSLQRRTNAFWGSSLSMSKSVLKDKLSFSAAANNPFTKYRNAIMNTTGSNFTQETYNQMYLRTFSLSMNYNFGKLKEKIKKNRRGISNTDVSEESNGL